MLLILRRATSGEEPNEGQSRTPTSSMPVMWGLYAREKTPRAALVAEKPILELDPTRPESTSLSAPQCPPKRLAPARVTRTT